jgi:P-type Cu2+ transporter
MEEMKNSNHSEHNNHMHMIETFRRRFWVSLILTLPILILSPLIQNILGYKLTFRFDNYILFSLSLLIYFYGGRPFLTGLFDELKKKQPGMMTLIGVAITVAFIYSAAITFGLKGKTFYWELATLIDIMLLGHWIEMKSVMGASNALQQLVQLMPSEAHLIQEGNKTKDIKSVNLKKMTRYLLDRVKRCQLTELLLMVKAM